MYDTDVRSGRITVGDLAGRSAKETEDFLLALQNKHSANTVVYLVTPEFARHDLTANVARCFEVEKHVYPHLDLDHIPESLGMRWPMGLSLGIYHTHLGCFSSHHDTTLDSGDGLPISQCCMLI